MHFVDLYYNYITMHVTKYIKFVNHILMTVADLEDHRRWLKRIEKMT